MLLGLLSPILRSFSNYIDKILLTRLTKRNASGRQTLFIFSSIVELSILLFCLTQDYRIFSLPASAIALLIFWGLLYVGSVIPYLQALENHDTFEVVPLFQLIPILSLLADYFVFGETLAVFHIIGVLIVSLAAMLLLCNNRNVFLFKKKVFFLMLLSTWLIVVKYSLFKRVNVDYPYRIATFREQFGMLLVGVPFLLQRKWRSDFVTVLRSNGLVFTFRNGMNELINTGWVMIANYILLYLLLSQVTLLNALQPFLVILFGYLLQHYFPKEIEQDISKNNLIQKLICSFLLVLWVYITTL